jgi:hypothetical protein
VRPTSYLIVSVIFTVGAGAIVFWKWESGPKGTSINEPEFRVTLPGQWSQEPSPDSARWSYHTEAKNEQLTVSMPLVITQQMSRDERVAIETKMPGFAAVVITEPTFGEADGLLAVRYRGVDSERQPRFHCLLLGSSRGRDDFLL